MIKEKIYNLINEYKYISFFVHIKPDPDALGASIGLMNFINLNFKNKKLRLIGIDQIESNRVNNFLLDQILSQDISKQSDKEFVEKSLAIILDTADNERVLTNLNNFAKKSIRIDHHIKVENFCDVEWIDETKIATCELVSMFIRHWNNVIINKSIINPLYTGLLTDSNRFLYENTTSNTFDVAKWMYEYQFDKLKIHDLLFNKSIEEKRLEDKLFAKVKQYKNVGYLIIKSKKIQSTKIYLLGGYKEFKIWTSIYYDYEKKIWFGSIRSNNIKINQIARKYNGGGHKYASGFKIKQKHDFKNIIKELNDLVCMENLNE